jgi:hypothetical protein
VLHRGEAVLTKEEAMRWRGGGGGGVTINNYIAAVQGMAGFEEALDEALRDARRFTA